MRIPNTNQTLHCVAEEIQVVAIAVAENYRGYQFTHF